MELGTLGYEPNAVDALAVATSALVPRSSSGNVPLSRSPFGVVQSFEIATPRNTPRGTPRSAQAADAGIREEFLRGALEQALRDNHRIRTDLGTAEQAEQATRADMAAGVAWAHSKGEMAMRAVSAIRNEADHACQQALYEQSEQFVQLYRGCMENQERAAGMIETLRSEYDTLRSESATNESARAGTRMSYKDFGHSWQLSSQLCLRPGRR
eukprot:2922288-Amphidinium_carterae.1